MPVEFETEETREGTRLKSFNPPEFKDVLTGAALVAAVNFQELLQGRIARFDTSIEAYSVDGAEEAAK